MSTEALAVVGGLLLVGGFAYYYMSSKPVPVARIETQAKPKQGHCIQLDLTFLAPKHTTQYSVEEIAKHNKADDLWIIVGTKVYDVTDFVPDHPGEVASILGRSGPGQDATRGFHGAQHPDSVEDQIRQYLIGELKHIEKEEVAKHNKPDDCWIVVEDKVYDVSTFVGQHPGGNAILKNAGTDSTQGFKSIGKHKSGTDNYSGADLQMAKFLIGQIKPDKPKAD